MTKRIADISQPKAALVAGFGLLIMTIFTLFAFSVHSGNKLGYKYGKSSVKALELGLKRGRKFERVGKNILRL